MKSTASRHIAPYIGAGLVSIFLIVIAYAMFFVPKMNESKALVEQTATLHTSNISLTAKAEALAATAKNLAPLKSQVAEFSSSFPAAAEQQNMLDTINAAAASTGVTLTTLSPDLPKVTEEVAPVQAPVSGGDAALKSVQTGTELPGPAPVSAANADGTASADTSTGQLGTVGLKIDGNGSLQAVQAFIVKIEALKRPLLIHEMQIEKNDSGYHVMLRGDTFIAKPLVTPEESK